MRIAKPLLMISMSVFLLAVSWSLLTGQLGLPRPAHAQTTDTFVGVIQSGVIGIGSYLAVTSSGDVWDFNVTGASGLSNPQFRGNIRGGAVPTTGDSSSNLKSRYGSGN